MNDVYEKPVVLFDGILEPGCGSPDVELWMEALLDE
jgi:hypothetical protein